MLAKRLPGILPPLTYPEALETTQVHSVAGLLPKGAGLLAEQVNPFTGQALSVCPLGWSHATVILAITEYVAKFEELSAVVTRG